VEGYLVNQATKLLKIHRNTLYRYEQLGLIVVQRDHNGWRRYSAEDLIALKEKLNSPPAEKRENV
jgi:DNA-binding transcriptional MerR regulator